MICEVAGIMVSLWSHDDNLSAWCLALKYDVAMSHGNMITISNVPDGIPQTKLLLLLFSPPASHSIVPLCNTSVSPVIQIFCVKIGKVVLVVPIR